MPKVIVKSQLWIPLTDDEVDDKIEEIINAEVKPPRFLSIVRFADDSLFRKAVEDGTYGPSTSMSDFSNLLYLGEVPNQLGHSIYVNLKTDKFFCVHTEELVEKTQEEL